MFLQPITVTTGVLLSNLIAASDFKNELIEFRLEKNGKIVQNGSSNDMIFTFSDLIVHLSKYFTLKKGDLIFTGTPAGVGSVRDPRRYLAVGEEIVTEIEGLGVLRNRCVAPG